MSTIIVNLIEARNLKNVQTFGKQDPYAVIDFGSKRFTTRTHENGGTAASAPPPPPPPAPSANTVPPLPCSVEPVLYAQGVGMSGSDAAARAR